MLRITLELCSHTMCGLTIEIYSFNAMTKVIRIANTQLGKDNQPRFIILD